jgi:hypothetical protein
MRCPLCGTRNGRRACPALNQTICAVCCGTKRQVEIACPPTCGYLASAREHPPAVVLRQQARDVSQLLPTIQHLTERQYQIFFLLQTAIVRHKPEGLARLVDEDVAGAAATVAATLETAARGVIYEHQAQSLPAQRLAGELRATIAQMREQGARIYDGEVAIVLRAIEAGARNTGGTAEAGDTRYLDLMRRLLQHSEAGGGTAEAAEGPRLIV